MVKQQVKKQEKEIHEISNKKKDEIAWLLNSFENYDTIMIVSIMGLSSLQLQKIRKKLSKEIVKITKLSLLFKFLELASIDKKQLGSLKKEVTESCGIIFTNSNVFDLVKALNENTEKKATKAGMIAQEEIIIPSGLTSLMPGPIVTELADAGVKAGIEKGKVAIKETFIIKKGELIKDAIANVLSKLNIKPVIVGLKPLTAYEKSTKLVYDSETLSLRIDTILASLASSAAVAYNLTLELSYLTKDNAEFFITRSFTEADILAEELEYVTKENITRFLEKVHLEAKAFEV